MFISYKNIFYKSLPAALVSLGMAAAVVFAWTEPSMAPPGKNVDPPINTGNVGQAKSGGLILNTGGAANGLIVQSGNVGIGTTNPGAKLDIQAAVGTDALKINTFKMVPISSTEMGVYDSSGNQILIFDQGI